MRAPDGYLTMGEAASRMGVSYYTIVRWTKSGRVRSFKHTRERFVLMEDINKQPMIGKKRRPKFNMHSKTIDLVCHQVRALRGNYFWPEITEHKGLESNRGAMVGIIGKFIPDAFRLDGWHKTISVYEVVVTHPMTAQKLDAYRLLVHAVLPWTLKLYEVRPGPRQDIFFSEEVSLSGPDGVTNPN